MRALTPQEAKPTPHAGLGASATTRIPHTNDVILLGLFAGLAAMVKPTAGAVAGAFVITLIAARRRWVRSTVLAFGAAMVAPVAVAVWTWRAGLLPEMPGLWREISLYGSQSTFAAEDLIKLVFVGMIGGFPFLVAWVFRRDSNGFGRSDGAKPRAANALVWFSVIWLLVECVGVVVQGRLYAYHLLPMAPPAALLFGAACAGGRRPVALIAALAPLVGVSIVANVPEFRELWAEGPRRLAASDYLRAHARPGDAVAGDGIERLLMETGLRCGTRYAHLFYLANHDDAPTEFGRRYIEDLEKNKPAWAVLRVDREAHVERQAEGLPMYIRRPVRRERFRAACAAIYRHVDAHYEVVAEMEGMRVYRRRGTGATRALSS